LIGTAIRELIQRFYSTYIDGSVRVFLTLLERTMFEKLYSKFNQLEGTQEVLQALLNKLLD